MPEWLETVYLQCVRAFARGYHREDMGTASDRIGAIRGGALMVAAIDTDNRIQPEYGLQRGGAMGIQSRGDIFWNAGNVAGPG